MFYFFKTTLANISGIFFLHIFIELKARNGEYDYLLKGCAVSPSDPGTSSMLCDGATTWFGNLLHPSAQFMMGDPPCSMTGWSSD